MSQRLAIGDAPEVALGDPVKSYAIPMAVHTPGAGTAAARTTPEAIAALSGGGGGAITDAVRYTPRYNNVEPEDYRVNGPIGPGEFGQLQRMGFGNAERELLIGDGMSFEQLPGGVRINKPGVYRVDTILNCGFQFVQIGGAFRLAFQMSQRVGDNFTFNSGAYIRPSFLSNPDATTLLSHSFLFRITPDNNLLTIDLQVRNVGSANTPSGLVALVQSMPLGTIGAASVALTRIG